ncbi:MAG: DNA polymerase III subunit epsilon [Pseudomonadota bacterium]
MRQILLDTETTGLDPKLGHRVIELAAVEMVNRRFSGRRFHRYLNPERASDVGALQVHGLTDEFLRDKPKFREVAAEFLEFVGGAELVIHNAPFDVAFLNHEFALIDLQPIAHYCPHITDTLKLAKELHPGKRNNLDSLCERYQIDNSKRTLHGALLDAELLGEVYLAMTRGQESLLMEVAAAPRQDEVVAVLPEVQGELRVIAADEAELAAHATVLEEIDKASKGRCLWKARS